MPDFVPTPCMEALLKIASSPRSAWSALRGSPLSTRNLEQHQAKHSPASVPIAKLLIPGELTIRNQQVAGSIPAGGSI